MLKITIQWEDLGVNAEYSCYMPDVAGNDAQGVTEYHVMLHADARGEHFEGQLERLRQAELRLLHEKGLRDARMVLKRYFVSDAANQGPLIDYAENCAVSVIQQPPLDGSKVAVWLYLVSGAEISRQDTFVKVSHNGYHHLYQWGLVSPVGDSFSQTKVLLENYESALVGAGKALGFADACLADNCVRTWFYVRDVDIQYAGMVRARKENFVEQGLTEKTHYIASTGIGGVPADPHAIVQLGTYALLGFEPEQQRYLYAPTHLNPTYEYGVTFERGVVMEYGDRAQVLISGTASINNKGEVVHLGDIEKQTARMIENVEVLLAEGHATFDDVMQMVVYLRDMADYETVKGIFGKRFPDTPKVFTLAPVCRPTWLVEMECIAVPSRVNPQYRNF